MTIMMTTIPSTTRTGNDEVLLGDGSEEGTLSTRQSRSNNASNNHHHEDVVEHLLLRQQQQQPLASPTTAAVNSMQQPLQHHHHLQHGEQEEEVLISIDDAMERLGTGRFQFIILIASGLCFAADAMQVILLSFLTIVVQQEWQLSDEMTASITSCLFAGAFTGTLILGPAADSVGRRPIFLWSAAVITTFGLGMAVTENYYALVFCVFGVGFGVGGLTVPFDILAEFLPADGRGTNLLLIEYFWTVGCLYVVVVAYLTLHGENHAWRLFVIMCSLPCAASLIVGYLYVPESARWLCAEGRTQEALHILRNAATMNGLDASVVFPPHIHLRQEESDKDATIADLFQPAWREITLRLWGTWGAFAFGYFGTILAITKVFAEPEESSSSGNDQGADSYDFDYSAIFVSSSAELVGTTLVILLVDRAGRIPSQVACYLCGGVTVFLLCACAESGAHRLILITLAFAARVFEMGGTCVTWVSTAEILTTEVRSTGHSTANAVARIGAFFCPFLVEGKSSLMRIGVVMLLIHLWTVLCVYKLPETKGRSMGASNDDTNALSSSERGSESDNGTTSEHDAVALIPQ